ncbi:hypothetical protein HAHE_34080 [Haloferula helveola]|uniref:Glucose/Sorbosone dehydrogenase domain-containing protein n=1 Tax=Haloferula helveola TaxID=490095 RepID=A0ABM7RGX1_9BACT|nr:hypothetical protein HAHE_34080 [Haloferula helveola]
MRIIIAALILSCGAACGGGLDNPVPVGPFVNGVFPSASPGSATGWAAVNAFPNLAFVDPMRLSEIPGLPGQLLLVCKNGQMWRFPNDPDVTPAEVVEVLDWRNETRRAGDMGFYSMVFHPDFGVPGATAENWVFVCYNKRNLLRNSDNSTYWRVSRFEWNFSTGTVEPTSEFNLINQYDPHGWHNGGGMFFGTDGFLYLVNGDGGSGWDYHNTSQRIDRGLFGGVLRIDVDNDPLKSHPIRRQPRNADFSFYLSHYPANASQGYGIPNDNPWQDPGGGILEEFYAIGLRSPQSMYFDEPTGDIWIGDVGQQDMEELTRISKGANAQWAFKEGTLNGPKAVPSTPLGTEQEPFYTFGRETGNCIIGGLRYRGAKWAEDLGGKVLVAGHSFGWVRALELDEGGELAGEEVLLNGLPTGNKVGISGFSTDSAGEVYMTILAGTNQGGGTILKLATAGVTAEPPGLLSQTGVFSNLTTLQPSAGMIPYEVASPLWSDGAVKSRWVILPNDGALDTAGERIVFSEDGPWLFPAGTVFVKHFEVPVDETDPSVMKRLETRFLVCTEGGGKYGVTYKWNEAGTDAVLMSAGVSEAYTVELAGGGSESRTWDYPGRADCLLCHNEASGQALGFRTAPLNRHCFYPVTGRTENQLETLNGLGAFDVTLTSDQLADFIEARPLGDPTAPLEHRVRSYLDTNCAHCHRPGGLVEGFDARLGTPLAEQNLINAEIEGFYWLGPDGRYVVPGDPSLSAIHVRSAAVGNGEAMPPLAKNLTDDAAVAALESFILGLESAEFLADGGSARPTRCSIAGPAFLDGQPFEVTVVFDKDVMDFDAADLSISGGTVIGLRGSGYYYVATIESTASVAEISVVGNAVDPDGFGSHASEVLVISGPTYYADWSAGYGVDGSAATQLADEDQDGIAKLLEFAFGLDPTLADHHPDEPLAVPPSGMPVGVWDAAAGRLGIRFLRRRNAPELVYKAEFGSNPDAMSGPGGTASVDVVDPEWERVTVWDAATAGPESKRFGRVRVTLSPP